MPFSIVYSHFGGKSQNVAMPEEKGFEKTRTDVKVLAHGAGI